MGAESELTGPIDPDIDLHVPSQRQELVRTHGGVLAVIAAGGGIGALARYGVGTVWPTTPGAFPWATFTVNVLGCLLIGVVMVLVTDLWSAHRLARPFLGAGVLGGFTTFSAYAAETHVLARSGAVGPALTYLVGTVLAAMLAVTAGVWLTRASLARRQKARP